MEEKYDELQTNFCATRCSSREKGAAGRRWAPLGAPFCRWLPLAAAGRICAKFATCSWEPLTMLNPHFVAGEHGLFEARESEDIWTI